MENELTPKTRRSALQKELDAFAELFRVLKTLEPEQRVRLFKAAQFMLGEGPAPEEAAE